MQHFHKAVNSFPTHTLLLKFKTPVTTVQVRVLWTVGGERLHTAFPHQGVSLAPEIEHSIVPGAPVPHISMSKSPTPHPNLQRWSVTTSRFKWLLPPEPFKSFLPF